VVTVQSAQLLRVVDRPPRRRQWGEFAVGLFMTAAVCVVEWLCWGLRANWWGWPIIIVIALVAAILLGVTVQYLVAPQASTDAG
jgi:hypothetical protein